MIAQLLQQQKKQIELNPPNSLSLLRAPLAFLFLSENPTLRNISVLVALISDCVDGYLARKYKYTSKLGAILTLSWINFLCFLFSQSLFSKETPCLAISAYDFSRPFFACLLYIF